MKHWGESLGKTVGVFIAIVLLALSLIYVAPLAAKGWPVDPAGATMMSYNSLIEAHAKFDRKPVWVIGALKIRNGTAYLSENIKWTRPSEERLCRADRVHHRGHR